MWYELATKLLRLRRYFFIGLIALGAAFALFGERVLRPFSPLCEAPPDYHADVPAEVRAEIDALFERGLLYCPKPPEGLEHLDGPVYWGSDGVNSLLFLQADDLSGTVVDRYAFGQDFEPGPRGGPPPTGFSNELGGRMLYGNRAPEGASYFYLVLGAPADADYAVDVRLEGPATENTTWYYRSIWRDLERLQRLLQGKTAAQQRLTSVRVPLPILPERWLGQLGRTVTPAMADDQGRPAFEKVRDVPADQPALYTVYNGPLGSGVWVAGVAASGTPALVLVPAGGGEPLTPDAEPQTWVTQASKQRLASFSLPALTPGTVYEARYWHEARDHESRAPDATFEVTAP